MPNEADNNTERVDWVRRPRRADLTKVHLAKVQEAWDRGIDIDFGLPPGQDNPTKKLADVTKVVVEGMPAPKPQDKNGSDSREET